MAKGSYTDSADARPPASRSRSCRAKERRWAVVTGASRGIGQAIAIRLAEDGYAISMVSSRRDGCRATLSQLESSGYVAEALTCNLGKRDEVLALSRELSRRHPKIHVLVNNAGITRMNQLKDYTDADWDAVIQVNLSAAFALSRNLLPSLESVGHGATIVNVSSSLSLLATEGLPAYLASKAGLNHLTQGMAVEIGRLGIRVNAVAPGFIRTDMFDQNHPPSRKAALAASHALGRIGEAKEVASVVSFLCSDDASFVSGAIIPVDAALTCRLAIPSII